MGPIEIECEGTEEFLKTELHELLKTVSTLQKVSGLDLNKSTSTTGSGTSEMLEIEGTTDTIAARLSVKSGPDLILAACAKMALVDKKMTFSRDEILAEMKGAPTYYKKTYNNNLSKYLGRLISTQKLNENQTGKYAFPSGVKAELVRQFAQ